jgi:hypothetical protein
MCAGAWTLKFCLKKASLVAAIAFLTCCAFPAQAQTTLSASSLSFGNVVEGQTSLVKSVTLKNTQAVSLSIISITVPTSSGYALAGSTTCPNPGSLAAGASCTIAVTLTPTALGAVAAGSVTITTNATNSPQAVALSGTGVTPTSLSTSAIGFGNVAVGVTSADQIRHLTNNQLTPLTIDSIIVTSPYALDPVNTTCANPGNLASGATCAIAITFTPTALGAAPAENLVVATNASNSPQTVPLTGTGVAPTTLSAALIAFGNVAVGSTSPDQIRHLTNNQSIALAISSITVPSPYALDPVNTTCANPGNLAGGATCAIAITFTPTASGAAPPSNLVVTTNASNSPQSVPLAGSGVSPTTFSTSAITFGNQAIDVTSADQIRHLTNNQSAPLAISSIIVPSPYALDPVNTTCPNPGNLAGSATCAIAITFTPTALGAAPAGSVVLTTNASNSPQSAPLTGSGVADTTVTPTSLAFGSQTVGGTSAIKAITFKNSESVAISISSIVAPAGGYAIDPSTTCPNPGALAAGASCTIGVTFDPTAVGAAPAGSVQISSSAINSPALVPVTGSGLAQTTLTPSSISFGNVAVTTASPTKTLTLENNQTGTLTITSLVFGGPFSLDTSSITTCPMAGGTVSGALAANSSCVIGVIFNPTTLGATAGGQVTVIDSAPSGPVFAALSGTGVAPVSLSPTSLNFGNVVTATTSATKSIVVTNYQTVNLSFSSITAPAPFAIAAGTTCITSTPVMPGKSCTVYLNFAPTALGPAPATVLTLTDGAAGSPQTAALTGTGVAPTTFSTSTLVFGNEVLNQTSADQIRHLTNNQTTALAIASITVPSPYALDPVNTTCANPGNLAAGATCAIAVSFTPTALGAAPASNLVLTTNASNSPQSAPLTGTGIPGVQLSPTSVTFPATLVGITSAAVSVKVENEQSAALHISGVTIVGTNSGDFGVTSLCPTAPAAVPAASNCTLSVTFTPLASGTRTATLSVADDAPNSPQTLTLKGSGNAPVLVSPTSITNFSSAVGTTSAYKTITITNEESTPLSITSFQFSGDFVQTSTTCGSAAPYTLAPSAACNVTVSFDPTIGGTRDGQLQVYDNALTSPQVVNLAGNGTSPLTVSPGSLTFSSQLVNTTSPAKVVTLTNHESESETFSLTPSGSFSATTNCASGVIAANSTCTLLISFAPTSTTPASQTGSVAIANSAPGGSTLSVSLTGAATGTNPAAAVSVVSPGAGAAGTVVPVTITGNGWTHFSASSVISFVDTNSSSNPVDITVSSATAVSPNQINATLTLAGGSGVVYGARNISVATPLSGGGTETAKLNSAFIIADPTLAHTITSVTPAFGSQGQTLTVNLTGNDTNFVQGTTFANFGDGITVDTLTINSLTTATATITISNTTPIGYRTITMVTGGEFATSVLSPQGNPIFQIGPNSAALVSVSSTTPAVTPVVEPQSFAGPIYLIATGTHFLQNATTVSIPGVTVGDVLVTSPTTATANVIVPATAPLGPESVTVATGGEIASLGNAFTVTGSTPALISVTPSSGVQGQTENVVITGNAFTTFNACPGGVLVADFTGEITTNSVVANSASQVTANISISQVANVGGITARLTCGGSGQATIFPFNFTITPSAASIISVSPNSAPQGGQLTLNVTGLNTIWDQAQTTAAFYPGGVPVPSVNEITINSPTSAQLAISVPTTTPPGTYGFYMATGGQIVSASINVYANTPTLTMNPANGLVPSNGTNSFSVSFTGQFTHFSQAGTLPVIAGEGVTLTNFTVNSLVGATGTINIAAGAATGPRLVTFTTGGEIVTTYFNVTSTPVGIIDISPFHGPQSTTLNVEIVGLNTHFVQGPTQVIFGGPQITVNSVTVNSDTDLVANITTSYLVGGVTTPTPPGWNAVYINTGAEMLITGFSVDAPASPIILSVVPDSAPQGSTDNPVTITGSLTNWVQGQSQLILGAGVTVANLNITSPTTATATISVSPTAPVGGNSVVMITGQEYDSGTGFSVTPSAAYISGVTSTATCVGNFIAYCGVSGGSGTPYVVAQLQTVMLNITGVGTHWLQGETVFSFGPGVNLDQTTVNSPTSATVQITVLSTAPVGFATATAFTDGETAALQQAIDIEEGSPKLLAISPQSAEQGATLNLEVLGRFTNWSSTPGNMPSAAFNQDITVNSVTVIDSETLSLNITVSPWAYVDGGPCGHVLTITSGNEQVSTAPIEDNFCVAQGAQQITSVTPLQGIQGSTEVLTITGSQTNFLEGQTQVSFGDSNFQVGEITVNSTTSLSVPVAITTSATTGFKNVTVTTYGQVASQQYSFTVLPGVGTLNEAIPNQYEQGVQNETVRLIGQYTHLDAESTATFGAGITVNSVTFVSQVPGGTGEIDANISIDPLSYVGGRTVTVTTPNLPCSESPTTAVFKGCVSGNPSGTGSEIESANVFQIIPGPAIISNVSPNTGNEGQEIVFNITGSATHWQQNFTQFYIAGGGSDITVNSVVINSETSATVDMTISQTANAGTRSVYMVTAGESLSDSGAFVVTGGVPVISYLTPGSALPGTNELQVTIVGNAYTQWTGTGANASTVNFGPGITIVSYTVDDASHISADIDVGPTCTSPGVPANCAQYGYRTVVVQTGPQGLTGNFDVVPPPPPPTPYVWYESPSSGIPGQTLTINFAGANTEWTPDTTTLTGWDANNITVNTFQITGAASATANITINPLAPAETMALTFNTSGTTYNDGCSGCEVDDASFRIFIAQPVLSIVDPGSGMQGAQNITVNIIGQFTAFDATTTFSFGPGITVNGPPVILGPTIATQSISIGQETPTGGYAVTATTPDAPPIAQVVGGAGFSVTPSLALISSVTPNTSPQGTTITVDVQGSNTHWDGSTSFSFGAGIVVTSTTVNSATDATLTLDIPPLASEGTTYAQARTGGEVATLNQAFVITAGTPLLLSSGPGSLQQQSSAVFTILSQATNWTSASPPVVSYGAGIEISNVQVTGPTSLTVDGSVDPTTPVGYRNLTVTTGTQTLGIINAMYVAPGPAVVNSVSPNSGGQGVELPAVQITGINTHWQQGVTTLSFPDVLVNSFTVTSPTTISADITVDLNVNPGQVSVTTTTLGEVATGINVFTITQTQPELAAVSPVSLPQGQTQNVTITGIDTSFSASSTVTFGAGVSVNSVTFNTATSLTVNITVSPTAALGYSNVTVTTGAQVVSSPTLFKVTAGPAAILSLGPNSGGQGESLAITVNGSQTHFAQGVTTASFGGGIQVTGVTVTGLLTATVNITIPNSTSLGAYNVTLTTGGETATILGGFTVSSGSPQLSAVNPPTGDQGATNLNVNLTGLFTNFVNGTSVANFGAGITVNSTTVSNSTSAMANITISNTAALGSRNVTVTTGAEVASITGGFTVLAGVPALTTISPTSGQAGTIVNVVVNGAFTTFQQGFSTVSFGDGITTNFVTVTSTTQLTANITIPSNAPVGNTYVSVTTNSQTQTLNNAFAVTAGTPVITVINPNIGTPGSNVTVNITGQYTNWVNGTTTASFGPGISVGGAADGVSGPVVVNSPTSLTAQLVISSGATLGPVDVITTTGGEVENVAGGFTIQPVTPPAPTLLSLSPGPNVGITVGSTNVGMPLNAVVTAVFSEPMSRTTITTSSVLMYLNSNPNQGNIPVTGTVALDPTGRVLTFTPSSLLAVNSTYIFQMTSAIQSATGVSFGNYNEDLYTIATAATAPPTVIAANPPASSTAGTNVSIQLEFSGDMDQNTASGLVVSTGSTPVAGTYTWNSEATCCTWGPGTILTFTPSAALAAGTTYTVAYGSPLTDTAGNALVPGSFTFNTGSGPDTVANNAGNNFNGLTNVGTNFAPVVTFSKAVNPIDINTSTLLLYNYDSGKYVAGTVALAANGLSATFTPSIPLLPDTYYYVHQASGAYDADGNTLNGGNGYFTTGSGEDLTAPIVSQVSPANGATSSPLNSEILVRFSSAINSNNTNVITVTPSGGSPIAGTATLASDLVTLAFVPAVQLEAGTVYTVQVSGYTDVVGNLGVPFSSSFTTSNSALAINVSTGFSAGGALITTNGTADGNWTVVPTSGTPVPADTVFSASGTAQPLYVVGSGNTGFYSGWPANGPNSDWIAINPNSVAGNTFGVYSTTFNIPGPSVPSNLCLAGAMGVDDNGELGINGTAIMSNLSAIGSLSPIDIPVSSYLVVGNNTLSLAWGTTDNSYEAFRLQGIIETCGASLTGGLKLSSATPSNGATGVSTNTTVTMNFNNPIDPATVNTTTLPIMIGYNSNQEVTGTYTVTGNQVVFTPDSPFPINTTIYVGTCNGPLDLAGDSAGGCYTQLMDFTTGSTATAPPDPLQVIAFTPAASATNVGLRAPVSATFNRSINLGTINSSDFGLFLGGGQSPWCTSYSHSQDDATVSFNCYALPASANMTAILGGGIQDWQGNPLQNFSSEFTTSPADSNTNGTIITTRPGNGASGVNAGMPIVLYSNLPINASGATNGIQVAQNNVLVPGTVQVLDSGYTLEFTPSTPFTGGALIQWWTTNTLYDATYNTPINPASGYFYVAASTATLVPAVQTTSPPAYSNPVPTNSIFDVQFNTPINPSTITPTTIYLYDSTTGLHPGVTYSQPQPNEILMTPTSTLPVNHYIYVYITTGLQSTTSVPATAANWYEYTGTTTDTTLPVVQSAVPFSGATNVGVNDTPAVVINKPVDQVSVNSSTFQVLNGSTPLAGGFTFNSTDTRIQFVPLAPLPPGIPLTMSINGVTDRVGHPITFSSGFTTGPGPDFTAPSIVWSSVTSNESIPTNSMITVQFSESMDVTTFTAGQPGACSNFYIYDYLAGTCVAATLSWNADQSTAYLTPTTPLPAGRQFELAVNGGTDLAGNQVGGISTVFYADFSPSTSAPTVVNFNPIGGKTGLGTNAIIEAQFSAPIDPNTISGVTLSTGGLTVATSPVLSAGNTVLQLVPAVPLSPGTLYKMTITGVMDPAGNPVAPVSNSFTTGVIYDISTASMTTSDPIYGTTVGTNATLKMVFNKPLNPITVNNSTFRMVLDDTSQFIPLTVTLSASGLEVTMTPQVALLPNTEYYFQACCGFQDEDGNNGSGVNVYFYTNGGTDTSSPTVTVTPPSSATGIPLNAQVTATLSVPMDPTSWSQTTIQLLNGSTPVAGTVSQTNSQTLTFVPSANLSASTGYTINVSGFTDSNGNTVVPYSSGFTTGTVAATNSLTLTSTNIANNSTGVSNTQPIVLVFSNPIDATTVTSGTIKVMLGNNSNQSIAGNYAVSGNTITFTPNSPYPVAYSNPPTDTNEIPIYVDTCGGPTDVLGDVYSGGSCYPNLLYFYVNTGGTYTTPLQVVSVSPANGAVNVGRDQSVSVTFNNSIGQGTASNYNSQLYSGQTLQDAGSYTLSSDNRTLTFNVGALNNGTTYTIDFPAGGISDQWGNTLAQTFTSTFTTEADPATGNGSVTSTAPSSNASSVPINTLLTLYLNRQANPATVAGSLTVVVNGQVYTGTVQTDASGYQIQYTPAAAFPNSATVQWFFSGASDVYGDAFNSTSGYFYTAAAVNPTTAQPTVVAVSPACCGITGLPTNTEVDIQYSQPLNASTVTTTSFFQNTGPAITYTVTLVSPTVVQIKPTSPFTASTQYGFCSNSTVMGTNGVAAPNSCWLTYFTTGATSDSTSGTVTVGPPNSSQNVGTNAYIRLQFSKPADRTTVNSTNVQITTGGNPIPGSWTYNYSSSNLVGANFYPLNPLPQSSVIQVAVSGILDYAGNEFSEPTVQFTTATQPDYTAPTATLDFSNDTTGVGTNASFTCLYSEAMDPSSITASGTYLYSYVTNADVPVTYSIAPDMMAVTMTPLAPLFANSEYYYYCENAVDLTGNAQSNAASYFFTGSGAVTAGPTLVEANPPSGMTNVPLNTGEGPWNNTSLNLLFSEPVATESLSNITLTPQGGSPIPIAVYPQDGNYIASVQLPYALASNTKYTYNVAGVTDLNGNLITPATSSFTTGSTFDFTNASVTATNPVSSATPLSGVPTSVTVTFSEALDPVLINGNEIYLRTHNTQTPVASTISFSSSPTPGTPTTITLTPITPLADSTIYDIYYYPTSWWMTDIAGNNATTNYGVLATFTTGTAAAINGVCGSANGGTFSTPPTTNLCSTGTVSGESNNGTFSWTCNGQYSGTNASCSATITPTQACLAPPSGLVSWWTGDNTANDSVGGNNGTLENGVTYGLGEINDAFNLNGSNQYVLVGQPVPASLQIQDDITMSAWVYMSSYPASGSYATVFGSEDSSTHAGVGLYITGASDSTGVPPGGIDFDIGNGSAFYSAFTTSQVPLNQWVLVTVVATASNPDQIYLDGVSQPTTTQGTVWNGTVSYSGSWFAIGQTVSNNWPFNGSIDDVQIYNAALTPTQVQAIYNAGNAGLCP